MTEVILKKQRPKHLALNQIRLPLPGFVSILHRVSGAGLFLMLPVLLALFGNSVGSPESYASYKSVLQACSAGLVVGVPSPLLCGYPLSSA